MTGRCRSCDKVGEVYTPEIHVSYRRVQRVWRVRVCRDCWRAWETLLDGACLNMQPGLPENEGRSAVWFL